MKLSLKERAAEYKQRKELKLNYFLTNLDNINGCILSNDTNTTYIISPSNHYKGWFQLTTFINNQPYSHTQERSIKELIENNINELIKYTIKEVA